MMSKSNDASKTPTITFSKEQQQMAENVLLNGRKLLMGKGLTLGESGTGGKIINGKVKSK